MSAAISFNVLIHAVEKGGEHIVEAFISEAGNLHLTVGPESDLLPGQRGNQVVSFAGDPESVHALLTKLLAAAEIAIVQSEGTDELVRIVIASEEFTAKGVMA